MCCTDGPVFEASALDWERVEATNGRERKLAITDTGCGMSHAEMAFFINQLAATGQTQGHDANHGVGAKITWNAGGVTRSRLKTAGGSYLSAHDPREVLGLGPTEKLDWIDVEWPQPANRKERFAGLAVDRYVTLTEGEGDRR